MLDPVALAVSGAMAALDGQPPAPITRDRVFELEAAMRRLPQVAVVVREYFSEGCYAREMFLTPGTLITGKIHKYANLNLISQGDVSVLIDGRMCRVQAPYTFVAPAGAKRVIYAHTAVTYTNVHGTRETDVEKIEAHFIAQDEAEFQAFLAAARRAFPQQKGG